LVMPGIIYLLVGGLSAHRSGSVRSAEIALSWEIGKVIAIHLGAV
jgi:hypothetical protein